MRRRSPWLALALAALPVLALGLACRRTSEGVVAAPVAPLEVVRVDIPADSQDKVARALRLDILPSLRPGDRLRLIVDLVEQPDLDALSRGIEADAPSRGERKTRAWQRLGGIESHRERFLAWLRAQGVRDVRVFRCVDRVAFDGSPGIAQRLAGRDDVAAIWGHRLGTTVVSAPPPAEHPPGAGRNWSLDTIGARRAWALGVKGRGVVVAVMDSGVTGRHPALAGRMAGPPAPVESGEESGEEPGEEIDAGQGHGTAVLAAAVGSMDLGVAPEAGWTAVDPIPSGRLDPEVLAAACDWLLETARPDVVIVPWDAADDGPAHELRIPFGALRTAGMAVVFAAGNYGPALGANRPPANLVKLAPDDAPAFSVGGVQESLRPYEYSSRGPNASDGSVFPQVVAPAVDVSITEASTNGVRAGNGTSYAAGFAAGALALVMSAHPELSGPKAEKLLRETSRDLGAPGPDEDFGNGLIDLSAEFPPTR